jgi:hypothetical protein
LRKIINKRSEKKKRKEKNLSIYENILNKNKIEVQIEKNKIENKKNEKEIGKY